MNFTKEQEEKILHCFDHGLSYVLILELVNIKVTNHMIGCLKKLLVNNDRDLNKKGRFNSNFYKLNKEDLQNYFDTSYNMTEVILKTGCSTVGENFISLERVISFFDINLDKYNENKKQTRDRVKRIKHLDYNSLIKNCFNRTTIKRYIIENNWLEYKCQRCGIIDNYNNEPITLQLDHINGDNKDNNLENLRFLCPNCHSQTSTHGSKNRKKKEKIKKKYVKKARKLKFEVSKEELEQLVKTKPMTQIGKMFSVSDNAVKQRCRKLGIELKPMRGYWMKNKKNKF